MALGFPSPEKALGTWELGPEHRLPAFYVQTKSHPQPPIGASVLRAWGPAYTPCDLAAFLGWLA